MVADPLGVVTVAFCSVGVDLNDLRLKRLPAAVHQVLLGAGPSVPGLSKYKGNWVTITGIVGEVDGGEVKLVVDLDSYRILGSLFLDYISLRKCRAG